MLFGVSQHFIVETRGGNPTNPYGLLHNQRAVMPKEAAADRRLFDEQQFEIKTRLRIKAQSPRPQTASALNKSHFRLDYVLGGCETSFKVMSPAIARPANLGEFASREESGKRKRFSAWEITDVNTRLELNLCTLLKRGKRRDFRILSFARINTFMLCDRYLEISQPFQV